ncbi:DUF1810 domain-containing protein, partial [Flavobacterium zepuense]
SIYYAIEGLAEATDYLKHPVLGKNLIEISRAVMTVEGRTANEIFGSPDDLKLRSSMTLFAQVKGADPVFNEVLIRYFAGLFDPLTLKLLEK